MGILCGTNSADRELEMLAPQTYSVLGDHAIAVLTEELDFYQSYEWCLNPHITAGEAVRHLEVELAKLAMLPNAWQLEEVLTNIFLFSCGLLNCIDDYLCGRTLRLPRRAARSPVGRTVNRLVETLSGTPWTRSRVARWRQQWLSSLNDFLSLMVAPGNSDKGRIVELAQGLGVVLKTTLPVDLQAKRLRIPSPFGHLDLTPNDVLRLGNAFICRFPDRGQPIVLLGLRTSGSYFAPLLRTLFQTRGYRNVELLTVEPKSDVGRRERQVLKRFAARGFWPLIVDDPPRTTRTMLAALDIVQRAGFKPSKVKILAPTHPARLDWLNTLPVDAVITLAPEQWYKRELLDPKAVEIRLTEYFCSQNFTRVSVLASRSAEQLNTHLRPSDERGVRLKRVFEVQLETPAGGTQTRYVLAKSVGCGWLGYSAFLAGYQLSGYVPPVFGLRDGILYMEWVPHQTIELGGERDKLLGAAASYTAARVRRLNLSGSIADMDLKQSHNGHRVLAQALSNAYGPFLMRSRVAAELRRQHQCPLPTLIDGNMRCGEWILALQGPVKADFEHHGMGKTALNVVDPAYDLADTLLNLELSEEEEGKFIRQYIAESGDTTIEQRLFLNKLLAGLWTMNEVQEQLFGAPRDRDAQQHYHSRFMNAWNFLTVQTARRCGSLSHPRTDLRWRAPLVVMDVDGLIDRRVFGFPATTAAGVKALSMLSAHEFSVALNTARSAAEVRDYCKAYSLAGGIAEHGSFLWDGVHRREQILISAEAARQLEELRNHLRQIPGVFLDERHLYSIRAFSYRDRSPERILSRLSSPQSSSIGDGALTPISTHVVHPLLVDLRLDKLAFHHTSIDTTIVAKESNKGTGLTALRDWVLAPGAETIAIGDDEPDLSMFRVASRSFAPSHIACRDQARLLGCWIASSSYQQGLLEIVRRILHPADEPCERCSQAENSMNGADDVFVSAIQAADRKWTANLVSAVCHPSTFNLFVR